MGKQYTAKPFMEEVESSTNSQPKSSYNYELRHAERYQQMKETLKPITVSEERKAQLTVKTLPKRRSSLFNRLSKEYDDLMEEERRFNEKMKQIQEEKERKRRAEELAFLDEEKRRRFQEAMISLAYAKLHGKGNKPK